MKRSHPILRLAARLILCPAFLLVTAWGALALLFRLDLPAPMGNALIVFWCVLGCGLLALLWLRPPLWA